MPDALPNCYLSTGLQNRMNSKVHLTSCLRLWLGTKGQVVFLVADVQNAEALQDEVGPNPLPLKRIGGGGNSCVR